VSRKWSADGEAGEAKTAAVLWVVGERVAADRAIELDAGWNLVSYLPRASRPVSGALESIEGQYTAVLGYDEGARSYYPDLDPTFNTLKEMTPLSGYWIKMTAPGTLRYPSGGAGEQGSGGAEEQKRGRAEARGGVRWAEGGAAVNPTNAWVNLYGPARDGERAALPEGTTVLALDPDGVICGAAQITMEGRYGLLACYGDDLTTPADEGADPGDDIRLVVDGEVLGHGTWTAHGERQRVPLRRDERWDVYLPLIRRE
jgi:hypothetical protein